MYFVGCERCGQHLTEKQFRSNAEAEDAARKLGHVVTDNHTGRKLIVCAECRDLREAAAS